MKRLIVACIVLTLLSAPANAGAAPVPASSWSEVSTIIDTGVREPNDVAVDSHGNVYIVENSAHRIKKVDADGNVSIFAGTGSAGAGSNGPANQSALDYPRGVAVDSDDKVYIADSNNNRIQVVDADGNVSTLPGTGALTGPAGVAIDTAGNVYIADTGNHRIQMVDAQANVSTVAGTGTQGTGDDGAATSSALRYPSDVAVDAAGNIYIADTYNHRIQKVDTDGDVTTLAGTDAAGEGADGDASNSALDTPNGVAVDGSGNVYIGDTENGRIQRVNIHGSVTNIPVAGLTTPHGVSVDASGSLYIADLAILDIGVYQGFDNQVLKLNFDTSNPTSSTGTTARVGERFTYTCADVGPSGMDTCTATLNGQAISNPSTATYPSRGTQSLAVTATDNAGNSSTTTVSIVVSGERELIGDYQNATGSRASIARLYMATFARNPEGAGFTYWEGRFDDGMTLQEIADFFATSPEFTSLYGNTTNTQFVDVMYENVMVRVAEPAGHSYWVGRLDQGMSQERMLLMFSDAPEFRGKTYTN